MNTGRQGRPVNLIDPLSELAVERRALDEDSFRRVIAVERKRTERSKAPFVLMLVEIANQNTAKSAPALETVMASVPAHQSVFGLKAAVAECILNAAAHGQTSYDGLVSSASDQIQAIVAMLT